MVLLTLTDSFLLTLQLLNFCPLLLSNLDFYYKHIEYFPRLVDFKNKLISVTNLNYKLLPVFLCI